MIDYTTIEIELIFEEVAKLPKTTDTSYVIPDVLELCEELEKCNVEYQYIKLKQGDQK